MANTTNFAVEKPTVGGYRNSWGGTLNTGLDKLTELLALALPIGTIQMYPKPSAPTATSNGGTWLVCDGASLVRTDYPDLHALITNTYGTYPSGTTFLLPDMRARSPLGYNSATISGRATRALALGSGVETHALSTGELSAHSHAIPATTHVHAIDDSTHIHTGNVDGGTGSTGLTATDSGHVHNYEVTPAWQSAGSPTTYHTSYNTGSTPADRSTDSGNAIVSISPASHSHSLTTTPTSHGVTGANASVIGITSTAPDTGSGTAHENMHPYLVINYIILAKHPSF